MMYDHTVFMHRCLELARMGEGHVAPNPMVGAVLVHDNRIIGEGYHQLFGGPHAEVHCLQSVKEEDRKLIPSSTLYVSLEPCAHYGKTPPCADLIIRNRIPRVVVGCRDPFTEVNGKGIEKLRAAGIDVTTGIMEEECVQLNKRFFVFHRLHRPYVMLKWAQTADGRLAHDDYSRVHISNAYTNRLVHQWRSHEMAILVGTNTARHDDPELTSRYWPGKNPLRLVVDKELRLPRHLKLFQTGPATIVFNLHRHTLPFEKITAGDLEGVQYYQVTEDTSLVPQIMHALYRMNIQSVLVEGGARLLQSFIDEQYWDEARIITNINMHLGKGLPVPVLQDATLSSTQNIFSDSISFYTNKQDISS